MADDKLGAEREERIDGKQSRKTLACKPDSSAVGQLQDCKLAPRKP